MASTAADLRERPTHPARDETRGALDFAIVIPTLNERANIEPLLAGIGGMLDGLNWEVVFVDDGSTDGTPELIERIAAMRGDVRLIRRFSRRGLSSAVVEGMLSTVAPVVAAMDADLQHDETILPKLYAAVRDGAGVAIGTRYGGTGSTGDWAPSRVKASNFATRLAQMATGVEVSDPMSGFFAARRDLVIEAAPHLWDGGFKILLDLLASLPSPPRVVEIPFTFRSRRHGESKLDAAVMVDFVLLLLEKQVGRFVPARLLMFLAIGAVGLIVQLLVLDLLLTVPEFSFDVAQIVAVIAAIGFNYVLNNALTYRDRRLKGVAWLVGLASFYLVCGIGAVANVGIGALIYRSQPIWWLAAAAGATVAAGWNFAASSFLTWHKR